MAEMFQSNWAKGYEVAPLPLYAGHVVAQRFTYAVNTTLNQLGTINNIIEIAPIPPGCRVVDMILDADDLDANGAPALTLSVGVMSGAWGVDDDARTCGAEFFSASTVGQAGGVVRPTLQSAFEVAEDDDWRSIGIKAAAAAATNAAGTIGLTVYYEAVGS